MLGALGEGHSLSLIRVPELPNDVFWSYDATSRQVLKMFFSVVSVRRMMMKTLIT